MDRIKAARSDRRVRQSDYLLVFAGLVLLVLFSSKGILRASATASKKH